MDSKIGKLFYFLYKINWQNIITVKNKVLDIREFLDKVKRLQKNEAGH